ncbi:MAG TPA: RhuM family protein [Crocinitomicaceae bacterium]|nr:RhuM family protein [Crocinitomicaceae bacterium]
MNEIIIFKTADEKVSVDVRFEDETVWLTQQQIADLFQRDRTLITKHINNIIKTEKLEEKVVCAFFAHTTQHGAIQRKTQTKQVEYYNLDAILSVGYRVNSKRGTQSRIWATQRLKEVLVQGYTIKKNVWTNSNKPFNLSVIVNFSVFTH